MHPINKFFNTIFKKPKELLGKLTSYAGGKFTKENLNSFTDYLKEKFFKKEDTDEYFRALTDTLCYAIKNQNDRIAYTIYEHFYTKFSNYRREHSDDPKAYPEVYYNSVLRTVEELATVRNKRFRFLSNASVGGIWLIGETGEYPVKEETYSWLWKIIITAIDYERDDMVMDYWANASQYAMLNLGEITPDYDFSDFENGPNNDEEIEKRSEERERFFEFAHALGGLTLYRQRYNLLKKMFEYTNSMPPKYELLPDSMDGVFSMYFKFRDPHYQNIHVIQRYYFPDTRGISGEGLVKHWMCKYAALLFLRQYTLRRYLSTQKPLKLPDIPKSQSEKKKWIRNLDHFKRLIEEVREDKELIEAVGFGFLNDEWVKESDNLSPKDFFEELEAELASAYEYEDIQQELLPTKVKQFENSTDRILSKTIEDYRRVANSSKIEKEYSSVSVGDIKQIVPKSPFVANQATSNLNFDTFLAEAQSRKIKKVVSETFRINRTQSFLFKNKYIFDAIEKFIGDEDEAIIVNFGVYLPFLINQLKIEGLSEEKFKETDIVNFQSYNRDQGRSLYVLKKSDFPSFIPSEPSKKIKERFNLKSVNDGYKIFASVIDLNKDDELRDELEGPEEELKRSVYLYISSRLEIRWQKKVKIFEIKQHTEFQEKGIPNSLDDINVSLD